MRARLAWFPPVLRFISQDVIPCKGQYKHVPLEKNRFLCPRFCKRGKGFQVLSIEKYEKTFF